MKVLEDIVYYVLGWGLAFLIMVTITVMTIGIPGNNS
jgi:hypothetical protein